MNNAMRIVRLVIEMPMCQERPGPPLLRRQRTVGDWWWWWRWRRRRRWWRWRWRRWWRRWRWRCGKIHECGGRCGAPADVGIYCRPQLRSFVRPRFVSLGDADSANTAGSSSAHSTMKPAVEDRAVAVPSLVWLCKYKAEAVMTRDGRLRGERHFTAKKLEAARPSPRSSQRCDLVKSKLRTRSGLKGQAESPCSSVLAALNGRQTMQVGQCFGQRTTRGNAVRAVV